MHLHASETSPRKMMHFFWGCHAYLASMSVLVSTAVITLYVHLNNELVMPTLLVALLHG
jgi:hypothetical protein